MPFLAMKIIDCLIQAALCCSKKTLSFQLISQEKCKSWKSFLQALQEEKTNPDISNITESISTYARSDKEVCLKLQRKLSENNLDLACDYVVKDLQELKVQEDVDAADREIFEHAEDVIERMQTDRDCLRVQLSRMERDFNREKEQLEIEQEEKNHCIEEL